MCYFHVVFKAEWTNLNRFQWFRTFLQCPEKLPEQVVARSFAILPRSAISGRARQWIQLKIEHSGRFKMLFCFCTAVLKSTNSALQVCIVKNVKFKHKFCINLWFLLFKKGRCAMVLLFISQKIYIDKTRHCKICVQFLQQSE